MKLSQAFLVCLSLAGASLPAWSQATETAVPGIRGTLDPRTGKFTAKLPLSGEAQPAATGTAIFFREQFNITIANYDQAATAAVCEVNMFSTDSNYGYSEFASVAATASGGGYTCSIPVLTLWTLQNPTSDSISVNISVTLYSQTTPIPIYRSSSQGLTLTQPGNGQTVVNTLNFSL